MNILVLLLETSKSIVDIREEKAALTGNLTIQPSLLEAFLLEVLFCINFAIEIKLYRNFKELKLIKEMALEKSYSTSCLNN